MIHFFSFQVNNELKRKTDEIDDNFKICWTNRIFSEWPLERNIWFDSSSSSWLDVAVAVIVVVVAVCFLFSSLVFLRWWKIRFHLFLFLSFFDSKIKSTSYQVTTLTVVKMVEEIWGQYHQLLHNVLAHGIWHDVKGAIQLHKRKRCLTNLLTQLLRMYAQLLRYVL